MSNIVEIDDAVVTAVAEKAAEAVKASMPEAVSADDIASKVLESLEKSAKK